MKHFETFSFFLSFSFSFFFFFPLSSIDRFFSTNNTREPTASCLATPFTCRYVANLKATLSCCTVDTAFSHPERLRKLFSIFLISIRYIFKESKRISTCLFIDLFASNSRFHRFLKIPRVTNSQIFFNNRLILNSPWGI